MFLKNHVTFLSSFSVMTIQNSINKDVWQLSSIKLNLSLLHYDWLIGKVKYA